MFQARFQIVTVVIIAVDQDREFQFFATLSASGISSEARRKVLEQLRLCTVIDDPKCCPITDDLGKKMLQGFLGGRFLHLDFDLHRLRFRALERVADFEMPFHPEIAKLRPMFEELSNAWHIGNAAAASVAVLSPEKHPHLLLR